MQSISHRLTGAALAAGGILLWIDFAELTAADPGFSLLECLCGITAGFGLAELWRAERLSRWEKLAAFLLLLVHIWTLWLWIPFLAGRSGGTGRHRFRRSLALMILPAAILVLFWMILQVLFPVEPGCPAWYGAAVLLLPLLVWGTVRSGWSLRVRSAAGVVSVLFGILFLLTGLLMLTHLVLWPALPWQDCGIWAAGLLICGMLLKRFPVPRPCRKLLCGIAAVIVIPAVCCLWLDFRYDLRNFGFPETQREIRDRLQKEAQPVIRAAQQYRRTHGEWPANPAGLIPGSPATGCFTENGEYRIVFQESRSPGSWVWQAAPEGPGKWELRSGGHPLLKRGARRYRYIFPAAE